MRNAQYLSQNLVLTNSLILFLLHFFKIVIFEMIISFFLDFKSNLVKKNKNGLEAYYFNSFQT